MTPFSYVAPVWLSPEECINIMRFGLKLNLQRAAGVTFGVNWYLVDMIRVMLNYYHMDFGDAIAVGDTFIDSEDVIMTRVQLAL
ncbi:MAG: hypothetical protein JRF52_08165 [Deltaproteobacteria bacterium]|nr:hypothetical protein [Deltaproteobacteria bacterium]